MLSSLVTGDSLLWRVTSGNLVFSKKKIASQDPCFFYQLQIFISFMETIHFLVLDSSKIVLLQELNPSPAQSSRRPSHRHKFARRSSDRWNTFSHHLLRFSNACLRLQTSLTRIFMLRSKSKSFSTTHASVTRKALENLNK